VSAASALVEATARRADDEVRGIRAALRQAYTDLVSAQVRAAELARARDRLRELADVLARREAAGDAAGYDRLRAEREVMDLDAEWSAATIERARAQASLAAFFGEPVDPATVQVVVPTQAAKLELPDVDQLVARAQMIRGEPSALQREIESARFAQRAAARRAIPEPEFVAGTKSSNLAGGDVGSVMSVHVTVPLFDHGQPELALARARVAQAEARALAFQVSLRAEVSALRSVVIERRATAERYRASSTASADQLERIVQVSYEAGERGILELLDAYRSGATARTRQADLDAAARQAEIELELVSGWEIQ
jgi:cobalt-zinc-cadmium efflux system outer membrane protein